MRPSKAWASVGVVVLTVAGLAYWKRAMTPPKVLEVGFPLSLLRGDAGLLDPANLDSVYQFYLLENLALGLVRDSSQAPSGFEPGLAASWERPSPTRWVFHLKPGLRWSDGAPVTPEQVAAHLLGLARGKYRHLVYLKQLTGATPSDGAVTLDFSGPVNDGLLHELSLADAAVLRQDTASGGWKAVSGAYSVEAYEPPRRLRLKRNPYYEGRPGMPESVELVGFSMADIAQFFKEKPIDLLKVPAPLFREPDQKVLAAAPAVLKGYPIWVYYLYFNPAKPAWRDAASRRDFAVVAERAAKDCSLPNLARERQLIPEGFSGHLPAVPERPAVLTGALKGRRIKISLLPSFQEAAPLIDSLRKAFAAAGATAEFSYAWNLEPGDDADAQLMQFSGNERDAMGTWQFMFSPEHGDLAAFRPEAEPYFKRIMAADGKEQREAALRDLHTRALQGDWAVPLFIEADVIAASRRVDISRLNPFDMRLRFFDVQWK